MIRQSRNSLKWRLTGHLAIWQALALLVLIAVNAVMLYYAWYGGKLRNIEGYRAVTVISEAVVRRSDGRLVVLDTPELRALRRDIPNLWYLIRSERGEVLRSGTIPAELVPLLPVMDRIQDAGIRHNGTRNSGQVGIIQWADTAAGRVQILASAYAKPSLATITELIRSSFGVALYLVVIMALATLIVTPLVVRGALRRLSRSVEDAENIDITRAGVRLSTDEVPLEVLPLVKAVNDALDRLDRGYERHKRFLADAAHELRTPIAILNTRISSLPAGNERTQLLEDAKRLTVLAGQLLDIQRLDQENAAWVDVDLASIAESVVLDLAPIAFSAGYQMSFEPPPTRAIIKGDETAVQRAIMNLVLNAIDHGGNRGEISVSVATPARVEVCDDGNGIPATEREEIFEPFYRLKRGGDGAGLGLNLVQRIMSYHGGYAEVIDRPGRGACLCLVFQSADDVP